jgi:SOS-response transcriptional repressor LexA
MAWAKLKGVTHLVIEIERLLAETGGSSYTNSKSPSQPVIHRIWSGETTNPKIETLRPIAKYFGVSISALVGDEPLPTEYIPGSYNANITSSKRVPILKWNQVLDLPNLPKTSPQMRIPTLLTEVDVGPNGYAVTIEDTSMEPYFRSGTRLIANYDLKPRSGDFVIVQIEGQKQPHFKQLVMDGNQSYLKPFHPDFKAFPLDREHRFLGVVVQTQWMPPLETQEVV